MSMFTLDVHTQTKIDSSCHVGFFFFFLMQVIKTFTAFWSSGTISLFFSPSFLCVSMTLW